jgi:hypothetical protein
MVSATAEQALRSDRPARTQTLVGCRAVAINMGSFSPTFSELGPQTGVDSRRNRAAGFETVQNSGCITGREFPSAGRCDGTGSSTWMVTPWFGALSSLKRLFSFLTRSCTAGIFTNLTDKSQSPTIVAHLEAVRRQLDRQR